MEVLAEHYLGLTCPLCGDTAPPAIAPDPCGHCDAMMEPQVDLGGLGRDPRQIAERPFDSMWRYAELLPIAAEAAVTLGEGCTPLVPAPSIAEQLDVGMVYIKLEGHNPTGSFKDRGATLAISAARGADTEQVALASAGNAGHAAAAYAARAGLEAHVFLPARSGFTQKAMVNVHGGDLTVVQGRLSDAGRAFREALSEHPEWFPVATDDTPYRREGKKTMYYEIVEQLGWQAPDAIVYPTGGGVGLLGMAKAADELDRIDWVEQKTRFFAAQATGCAPVVEAFDAGADDVGAVDGPDTICGGIEVNAPTAGREILKVLRDTDGGAVTTDDDAIVDAALDLAASEGLGIAPTAAAALSGAEVLANEGTFDEDDDVVLVATGTGLKEADVLRSQLMAHGV